MASYISAGSAMGAHIKQSWASDHEQFMTECKVKKYLEKKLAQLAKAREPTPLDRSARAAAIERLQALLPTAFPRPDRIRVVAYGSFLSDCYSRGSDLDLALVGKVAVPPVGGAPEEVAGARAVAYMALGALDRSRWESLLTQLANALEKSGVSRGPVERVLQARVPIIKFIESRSGIQCDVCVTTRGCEFKGEVMRLLHELQPELAPLVRLVKLWARQHDINSAASGTLNSWSLALMAIFSLQTFPGAPMLPPLWRLFYDEEPIDGRGPGRPLQDASVSPDAMLARAKSKCADRANGLVDPGAAPSRTEQLLWFLSSFAATTGLLRGSRIYREWRVSPWFGRGYEQRYVHYYMMAVEEPFDSNDNTARSVGIERRFTTTLPYIAWVFANSVQALANAGTVTGAARTLAWLFGPEALPIIGMEALQVPPGGVQPSQLQLLQRMLPPAEGNTVPPTKAGSEQGQADDAKEQARAACDAFRALLAATEAGSPILTLKDFKDAGSPRASAAPPAPTSALPYGMMTAAAAAAPGPLLPYMTAAAAAAPAPPLPYGMTAAVAASKSDPDISSEGPTEDGGRAAVTRLGYFQGYSSYAYGQQYDRPYAVPQDAPPGQAAHSYGGGMPYAPSAGVPGMRQHQPEQLQQPPPQSMLPPHLRPPGPLGVFPPFGGAALNVPPGVDAPPGANVPPGVFPPALMPQQQPYQQQGQQPYPQRGQHPYQQPYQPQGQQLYQQPYQPQGQQPYQQPYQSQGQQPYQQPYQSQGQLPYQQQPGQEVDHGTLRFGSFPSASDDASAALAANLQFGDFPSLQQIQLREQQQQQQQPREEQH